METSGTIEKALEVLFHLHSEGGPRGVTAIGRSLGLPKSTAHRLVTALGQRGLVERDDRGQYRPGMALVALGLGVLEHEPVVAAATPVLEETAAEVGETMFLAAARAGRLIVLDKCEGSGFLRASPRVGTEIPVHATAIGKVYLAFEPELVNLGALERYTDYSPADADALRDEVETVRAQGWALQHDQWVEGLAAFAAPVRVRGRLVGAVALAGPTARVIRGDREALSALVCAATRRISARMEGTAL